MNKKIQILLVALCLFLGPIIVYASDAGAACERDFKDDVWMSGRVGLGAGLFCTAVGSAALTKVCGAKGPLMLLTGVIGLFSTLQLVRKNIEYKTKDLKRCGDGKNRWWVDGCCYSSPRSLWRAYQNDNKQFAQQILTVLEGSFPVPQDRSKIKTYVLSSLESNIADIDKKLSSVSKWTDCTRKLADYFGCSPYDVEFFIVDNEREDDVKKCISESLLHNGCDLFVRGGWSSTTINYKFGIIEMVHPWLYGPLYNSATWYCWQLLLQRARFKTLYNIVTNVPSYDAQTHLEVGLDGVQRD